LLAVIIITVCILAYIVI